MATTQQVVLSVPDISCEHCVRAIDGALGALQGVRSVGADIPSKTVRVSYDASQVSLEQIEAALDEAGYTVAR